MNRRLLRAPACGLAAAVLAGVLLAVFYGFRSSLAVDFDRELPRLVRGVYPPERDRPTGLTFAWSGPEAALKLPGLDRRVDWTLEVRLRGARPTPEENPELAFLADGVVVDRRPARVDFETYRVTIPARPDRARGVVVGLRASRTFNPGPSDPRDLGFMLDRITLKPGGLVSPSRPVVAAAAACGGLLALALVLIGATPTASILGGTAVGAGVSSLMARGFGPYSDFSSTALTICFWTASLLVATGFAIERLRGRRLRNTARFALAFSAGAAILKLLVLLHPDLPIGDALFHAHRFRTVVDGNLFFTSIAPGNYRFPYAPGLYVAAAPFAGTVTRDTGDMSLLRIYVVALDAAAASLLYLMIARGWGDRLAGALAVALYHLTPLDFMIATVGNLTNAFAESLAVLALVLIADPGLRLEHRWRTIVLAAVLAAAFTSHTSTFAILAVACAFVPAAFLWKGGPALRSPAAAVLLASAVAVILAVALYYAHFLGTYREELARITGETASNAPDAGGRTILDRLSATPYYLRTYFGLPLLTLAVVGAWRLHARGARDRTTLATLGWTAACATFLLIGILTPVDMRYYLAAIPAVAVTGSAGASWLWTSSRLPRATAAVLLAGVVIAGVTNILTF